MARKPRIEYPGAFYHIMTRGNRKIKIFFDDEDRERFIETISRYKKKYDLVVYAYTLMDNHIHLLIERGSAPLSKAMQGMLQSYTQWHNRRYEKVGHLFQGRYKAILCDKDSYLLVLIRYIHLNPVRAGYVDVPEEYQWSSHRAYLGLSRSDIVDVDFALGQFAPKRGKAIRLYREFINEELAGGRREEFYCMRDQRILGDEAFYWKVIERIKQKPTRMAGVINDKALEDIVKEVNQRTGVGPDELSSRKRSLHIMRARSLFIRLCSLYTKMKRRDMAKFLNREPGSLLYLERILPESEFVEIIDGLRW